MKSVWICVIHMNSAYPPLTLLLLIKLSNRKLIIIATAHFVEVPLYPHIKLDSVETSQRLHVWIVHPCLIKQIFCCPTWLFLTYYAESSVETEHEIETHSLLFFCSFLRANNNSLSTRNSYYRSTRSFTPVNQDCGDTALVNCPVWCSLDLDWCSQPSALVNWGLLHSRYLRCLGTGFKTPRPPQTRGSVTAGFGCTLHCCVRDKMSAVLFTFMPSQGGIRDTEVKMHLLCMCSKNSTALPLIGSHSAFHWSLFAGSLRSTLLCSSPCYS